LWQPLIVRLLLLLLLRVCLFVFEQSD